MHAREPVVITLVHMLRRHAVQLQIIAGDAHRAAVADAHVERAERHHAAHERELRLSGGELTAHAHQLVGRFVGTVGHGRPDFEGDHSTPTSGVVDWRKNFIPVCREKNFLGALRDYTSDDDRPTR